MLFLRSQINEQMLSVNALNFTLHHLLRVAFPSHSDLICVLEIADNHLAAKIDDTFTICFEMLTDQEMQQLRHGQLSAQCLAIDSLNAAVPTFKSGNATRSESTYNDSNKTLYVPFDIVTLPFLLLSKLDECDDSPRDRHGRFQFSYSLAARYNFVTLPIVDYYAIWLRNQLTSKLTFGLTTRSSRVIPTHDIDILERFHSPWQAHKSILGRDMLIDHSLTITKQSWAAYRKWRNNPHNDPYLLAIKSLALQATSHNAHAVFFFKAQLEGENDATYSYCKPQMSQIVDFLEKQGMTIGLHGSYDSHADAKLFSIEKQRLDTLTQAPTTHARQHYLRFRPENSASVQMWQQAGIQHDYTLGYAEQPGFRCGTCHPFPLYDLEHDCPTNVIEHPLIVMDGSLFDYLKLNLQDSVALIRQLQQRCQDVEGDFVFLWHNHTTTRIFQRYYELCTRTIYNE